MAGENVAKGDKPRDRGVMTVEDRVNPAKQMTGWSGVVGIELIEKGGPAAALGQRGRVAHMSTAATTAATDFRVMEGRNGTGLHLGGTTRWSHEPGPPLPLPG